jgi:hypothetical protein
MARGIVKVTLYSNGMVTCKDRLGRQSLSLQGFYPDVKDKVLSNTDDQVKWFINDNNNEKEIN